MAGFKTFTAAPLSVADVNGYLMAQANIQCTAATRPATPHQGMVIYETDTDTWLYCSNATGPIWSAPGSGEWLWQQQVVNFGDFTTGSFTVITTASAISIPTWARDGTALLDMNVTTCFLGITASGVFRLRLGAGAAAGTPYGLTSSSGEMFTTAMRMQYTIPAATTTVSPVIQAIRDSGTGGLRWTTAVNSIADWNYSIHR